MAVLTLVSAISEHETFFVGIWVSSVILEAFLGNGLFRVSLFGPFSFFFEYFTTFVFFWCIDYWRLVAKLFHDAD
jgi:hypothetical protein